MALTHHFKLDDNAASTTVVATVGTNATLAGGDNTSVKHLGSGPGGTITWAFDFNGSDDWIDLSAAPLDKAAGSPWSVSLWVKPDSVTANVVAGRSGVAGRGITIASSTTINVDSSVGTPTLTFTVPAVSVGTWYHLFITKTAGNSCRLFLNGTESSTGAQSLGGTFTINALGKRTTFFDGAMSMCRFWDSDETANVATWRSEGVTSGNRRRREIIISGGVL